MQCGTPASGTSNSHQIRISSVTLKSTKLFKWAKLSIGEESTPPIHQDAREINSRLHKFDLPRNLVFSPSYTLRVQYRRPTSIRGGSDIVISIQEVLNGYSHDKGGEQEWRHSYRSSEVVVRIEVDSSTPTTSGMARHQGQSTSTTNPNTDGDGTGALRPTTEEILQVCPRFRILVIGKSGAGKSSLINKTFGVTDAHVSHHTPGTADINHEIFSEENPRFVLHDSRGFEHGEDDSVHTVQRFIQERSKKLDIKDKLHAIWLCVEIPIASGRLLERGVEELLRSKIEGKLGEVPIIVIFTKYDVLVGSEKVELAKLEQELTPESEGAKNMIEEAEVNAKKKLERECIVPLEEIVKGKVPYTTASTNQRYTFMLTKLIQITFDKVYDYLAMASVVTGIAQKVNPNVKIQTSIEVGKKKYWQGLASSVNFPGHTLQSCLEVIHTDIVNVWDFNDSHKFLHSEQFKALMSNGVDLSKKDSGHDPNRILSVGLPMIGTLAGVVSALAGPAAPIVLPIAAAFVFAVWAREVYHNSLITLRRLMTYIVDLMLVMQNVFWIQELLASPQRPRLPLTRRLIKLAFWVHINSDERSSLLVQIDEFTKTAKLVNSSGADDTFNKISELINSWSINAEQVLKNQAETKINGLWENEEEPWDILRSSVSDRGSVIGSVMGWTDVVPQSP